MISTQDSPVTPAGPAASAARSTNAKSIIAALGMLPVLIIVAIGFHLLSDGRVFTPQNISVVLQQASVNTVPAAGMTFVILTGGIDLSVGPVPAASAMAGLIVSNMPDVSALWLLTALFVGVGFGVLNGILISALKLSPVIVTLGALTAVRGIARLMGADTTIFNPDIPFAFIGNGSLPIIPGLSELPWLAVIALGVIVLSWFVLKRTVLGTHIYSVGGNEAAARLSGINVPRIYLIVYGISGLCAGLGGVMLSTRLYAANGLQLGQAYELDAIAAVILGGAPPSSAASARSGAR